ncbi:MAG: NAD(P)-binding protein [Myxococcota bacterium]
MKGRRVVLRRARSRPVTAGATQRQGPVRGVAREAAQVQEAARVREPVVIRVRKWLRAKMSRERYVIVGAGISGLATALLLAKQKPDAEIEVWEATRETGGLLAPVDFTGVACDRGSHRIHPQADPLLLQMTAQQGWQSRPRRGRLVLNQRHIHYPLRLLGFLRGLGWQNSMQMGWGFVRRPGSFRSFLQWESQRTLVEAEDQGFEAFVKERVGDAAYQHFYRPYVEKVWGMPPEELSKTVAKQRVSMTNPMKILLHKLASVGQKLPATFLYPKYGMSSLVEWMFAQARKQGVQFRMETDVSHRNIQSMDASAIFFSGHLSALAPDYQLNHRGLYLLYMTVPQGAVEACDTFYLPEARYWFGRVSQISQFSEALSKQGQTILCLEIPEGNWGPHKDFFEDWPMLHAQLKASGILKTSVALLAQHQLYMPRVYPMYTRSWVDRWKRAVDEVTRMERVFLMGRQGLFLHCNMDHCVRIAKEAVACAIEKRCSKAWRKQVDQFLDLRVRD